jgi:hypothetical protein
MRPLQDWAQLLLLMPLLRQQQLWMWLHPVQVLWQLSEGLQVLQLPHVQ